MFGGDPCLWWYVLYLQRFPKKLTGDTLIVILEEWVTEGRSARADKAHVRHLRHDGHVAPGPRVRNDLMDHDESGHDHQRSWLGSH